MTTRKDTTQVLRRDHDELKRAADKINLPDLTFPCDSPSPRSEAWRGLGLVPTRPKIRG